MLKKPSILSSFSWRLLVTKTDLGVRLKRLGNCLEVNSDLPADAPSKNLAALWIRATFHDMATLDLSNANNPGGPDATLVYTVNQTENAGLENTIADRFVPDKTLASKADLIALAGLVSVRHCGGPDIKFKGGRRDVAPDRVIVENTQRIPAMNEAYPSVKAKMRRMGFDNVDIAVLGKC